LGPDSYREKRVVGGYNCMILRVLRITNPNSTKAGIANPSDKQAHLSI